jgi:hypothetical protein
MIFGEVPTSLEIGGWVLCLFGLAGGVNQVLKIFDRTKEHPPPRDTYQLKGDYVTRRELDALDKDLGELADDVAKLREKIEHDAEVSAAAATARAEKIHGRIDEVLSAMSDLRERVGRGMRGK